MPRSGEAEESDVEIPAYSLLPQLPLPLGWTLAPPLKAVTTAGGAAFP